MYVIREDQQHLKDVELHLYRKVCLLVCPSVLELCRKNRSKRRIYQLTKLVSLLDCYHLLFQTRNNRTPPLFPFSSTLELFLLYKNKQRNSHWNFKLLPLEADFPFCWVPYSKVKPYKKKKKENRVKITTFQSEPWVIYDNHQLVEL